MNQRHTIRRGILTLATAAWIILAICPAFAAKTKDEKSRLDDFTFALEELRVTQTPLDSDSIRPFLTNGGDIDLFRADNGREWRVIMDARRGRPTLIDGGAIPFIPGRANSLPWAGPDGEWRGNSDIPVSHVEKLARAFMVRYMRVFSVDPSELALYPLGSGPAGESLYFIRFQWMVAGIPVEGATVSFIINNGNLIQMATQNIGDLSLDPIPSLSPESALQILRGYLGPDASAGDKVLDPGSLVIIPTTPAGQDPDVYESAKYGHLISYRLVYRVVFQRPEVTGTWEGLIDAHSGEVVRFGDINRYGRIHGGIRPSDGLPPEEDHPFPGADTDNGVRNTFTDSSGNFVGNNATTQLKGQYCKINDTCGAISASTTTGDIDFLMGPAGTDCSVPTGNTYGAGNTKPSRTIFWNVSALNVRAQVWNPSNTWLTNKANAVTVNVNQAAQCNASAGGGIINFYKKAAGCNNLGEIPGVAMHEWGHLYDTNDGSGQQDRPVETYADFIAIMSTHNSCLGAAFLTSGNCGGYGNACTACTGVRDIDYKKHTSQTPWTSANHGTLWSCGAGSYNGPCGWEDHCESGIAAQALWDLAAWDLTQPPTGMDANSAWALMDRLWFTGVITMDDFYTCAAAVTSGCTGNTAYNALRAVDDTGDGTANGTPHAAAIYSALARHNLACGAAGDATNQNQTTCPTLTITTLSGSASNNQIDLSWPAVANATRYWIFRNEGTCSAGFTRIATVNAPTLTYTDTAVANGTTYNYRLQAATASDACTSAISNCLTLTPIPCTTPGTPAIGTVTVPGLNQLRVSWTAGSPAGATYNIYRSFGACPGGTFALIASGVAASPYTDTNVSGTVTYAYKVTAVDGTGGCESAQSGCASATATGTCNAAPAFGGVTSVTNPALANCTLDLSWSAASAFCGGPVTYSVYRSTTTPFTPAAGNRIASGISGLTYSDTGALANGSTYYYIVRASDGANGAEDANLATLPGVPTGPIASGTWTDDAGDTGTAKLAMDPSWSVYASGGKTAPKVYATGAYGNNVCIALTTPTLLLGTGSSLSFASKYGIETNWDAGILEVATAPTFTNWTKLPITTYPNSLTNAGNSCGIATGAANVAFSLTNAAPAYPASPYTASLSAYNGQQVKIRWNLGSDTTLNSSGWWVDDISVTNVQVPGTCTTGGGCSAPGAPILAPASGTCSGVDLAWTAGSGTTNAYNVYRVTGACGGAYAKIAGPITGTTYSDTTAVAGTGYAYVVRGACDAAGNTESPNSTCRTATRLAAPVPTITGASANTCPSATVTLTTEAGKSNYQWYAAGSPIGGATANAYGAAATGSYTVSYTDTNGCAGTSAAKAVTITPCVPNIVYLSNLAPVEVMGDGDGVMEAGEKWQIQVTVTNTGLASATAVFGALQGEGLTHCDNPGAFGSIAVGGTGTTTFTFIPNPASWYGTYACGASIGFDLVSKSSDGGAYTYPADTNFATRTVGTLGGTVNLFGPDDMTANIGSWTPAGTNTAWNAGAAHCAPHSNGYARIHAVSASVGSITLTTPVSTVGYAAASVTADYAVSNTGGTPQLLMQWSTDGLAWTTEYSFPASTTFTCGNSTPLPAAALGQATLYIRFTFTQTTGNNRYGFVDNVTIQGTLAGNCDTGTATCAAPEVSGTAPTAMKAAKSSTPGLVVLSFDDVAGVTGYNVYEGNIGTWYGHGGAAGNVCNVTTSAAAGRRATASAGLGTAGNHYYLVTAFTTTAEGPSGYDSSGGEITPAQSTCAP